MSETQKVYNKILNDIHEHVISTDQELKQAINQYTLDVGGKDFLYELLIMELSMNLTI